MSYFQQGDVLLKQAEKTPKGLKPFKGDLLYKGQNHHHRVRGKFKIATKENVTFLISSGCELFHEEHKAIKIPKGNYQLDIVREYDHWREESRRVID